MGNAISATLDGRYLRGDSCRESSSAGLVRVSTGERLRPGRCHRNYGARENIPFRRQGRQIPRQPRQEEAKQDLSQAEHSSENPTCPDSVCERDNSGSVVRSGALVVGARVEPYGRCLTDPRTLDVILEELDGFLVGEARSHQNFQNL